MSSLRDNYNRITGTYPKLDSGFVQYNDNQYNSENVFTVNEGSIAKIPNNAAFIAGDGIQNTILYDGNIITPDAINDTYILRVNFTAYNSFKNGEFLLTLDISSTGNDSIVIASLPVRVLRSIDVSIPYSISTPFYVSETFLTNGGHILLRAVTGKMSLYDISFVLFKIHSGEKLAQLGSN